MNSKIHACLLFLLTSVSLRAAAAELTLVGDWDVRVTLPAAAAGVTGLSATLHVVPTPLTTVTAERHGALPLFNPNAGGWVKGAQLQSVRAQETTTPHLLEPTSLILRAGPEPDAETFRADEDYAADLNWGTIGRLPNGRIKEGQSVFACYRYGQLRLDAVVLGRDGKIVLRQGEPRAAAPRPPKVEEGERHLANIWLPGRVKKLAPEHLFPVLETSYPEPPKPTPSPAEKLLPKTMAKLRSGGPVRIMAWGDSVTVGTFVPDPPRNRWQEQFVTRLSAVFPQAKIELVTEAWGGRNTASYLGEPPGSDHNYREKVLGAKPDLLISEFVNDAGMTPEQVEERYGKLLADFQAIGAEWIILTPHYVRPDWMGLVRERDVDQDPRPYVAGLRLFASRHGVALADASLRYGRLWRQGIPFSSLMLNSINHPDARGMKLFADALMELWPDAGKAASSVEGSAQSPNPGTPWPATDALGRRLPSPSDVGPPRLDRFVGMFYFLWHNDRGGKSPNWEGPYDVAKILAHDPDALKKPNSPLWGPIGMYHYWGEPQYGYYLSTDAWVLRRHAELLADAGIDTLIFDTTNALSYPEVYRKLCEVFRRIRQGGGRTPQIVFMLNTKAGETAQEIYRDLYQPGLYRELWFQWQGKPLMICDPELASPEVREHLTLRRAHWPFALTNTPYAWHWEATYPQPYGYTDDPKKPEQVIVSVAQNLRQADGKVTNMSDGNARGRSFHDGKQDTTPGAVNYGYNVQEQWKRVFELDPPFAMVTGWNEWIAGRWGTPGGPLVFVDQFTEEFSRDIEPMRGGHGDNYYWQLVDNVRHFKGAPALPKGSAPQSIRIDAGFEQWREVGPEFLDHEGETIPRDSDGAAGTHYTNRTGRNDLIASKVARDAESVYFYVRTRETLTPRTDPNWMWLLIDADQNAATGWQGYDFIVNRMVESDGSTWLEKNTGGWTWEKVVRLNYRSQGNELHVAVPRSALGLTGEKPGLSIDFKWADSLQHPGDIMDFYASGDVAPEGRFMYRYVTE